MNWLCRLGAVLAGGGVRGLPRQTKLMGFARPWWFRLSALLWIFGCGARSSPMDQGTAGPVGSGSSGGQAAVVDSGASTSSGSDDGGAGPRLLNDAAADLAPCAPSGNLFYLDLVESSELGPSGPQLYANPGFDVFAVPYAFQVMPGAYAPGPILAVTAPEGTSPVPGSYPLDGNQSSWPSVKVTSGAVECLPQSGSIDLLELPVLSQQDEDGGTKILLSFDILCAGVWELRRRFVGVSGSASERRNSIAKASGFEAHVTRPGAT